MKRLLTALMILAVPALAADNIVLELAHHWQTSKAYTLAIAQQMPEADYGYKPNPDQMTFKEQLLHIADMNDYFFAQITGNKKPAPRPERLDKASVIKAVGDSFDRAIKIVESLTSEQASQKIEILLQAADHTTHHRGQCVVYLRARNIKPAEYQF